VQLHSKDGQCKKEKKIVGWKPDNGEIVAQNETFPILQSDNYKENGFHFKVKISEN